ncbi:hypothetical protein A2634_01710 [Candidatus Amesbacteria bacterium RIFCSPHIGHO2_01_FULL_48_32]|uniref:Type II secretion system protein GspF domain-containing protein n=1 Tax=Candidatus Amesbacteria bacterium RIFCSPLOWO2_01_FULL_48_25 TaxID=1797259 RepID=A0A1F4ZC34_9BACT|nr:MAG: hypothetical protein A2634_01710 [Candidatus Amesbacteria bacterium RIFCSPHIGHO2_01_FULL_48_32]OGD03758.1 MAG: hypothetical protein A2989_03695 [Candidatus Amesbacteria bacterium RIFCSPLOWO2_01_FULL_48_25]HJZ05894.1 type II secretion system F family protein [Patescibacteria group bacterium]
MRYKYRARNELGQPVAGVVEAITALSAAGVLREQKLTPISINETGGGVNLGNVFSMFGKVGTAELATFTRQLSTMITAGLPLTDALNLLKAQSGRAFSPIIGAVMADVQGGVSLSGALGKHPQVFSKVYISLVRAGEAAGVMETIMNRLADTLEKGREFRSKVIGAMIYPIIILIGMVAVVIIMVVVVIPKLTALYEDFDAELPAATQVLIAVSDFAINYWWLAIAMGVGAVFGIVAFLRTPNGREIKDRLVVKIPVWGELVQKVMLTEVTRTLGLLVSAGVSIVEALTIVSEAAGNVIVERDLRRISRQVEKGFPVSISFSESMVFPAIVGQMIAVGEETGKMDEVLTKMSTYFESESEQRVKGLTTAIEPIIIMVLAVGVGFLMYAVVMPLYSITNSL